MVIVYTFVKLHITDTVWRISTNNNNYYKTIFNVVGLRNVYYYNNVLITKR